MSVVGETAGGGGWACALVVSLLVFGCESSSAPEDAGDDGAARDDAQVPDAACLHYAPLRQAFFGDMHVHSALSLDANLQGTRLRPADAYRFARGERVGLPPYDADGEPLRTLKLARPLDFAAVTDHAEFLGHVRVCTDPSHDGYGSEACRGYRDDPDGSFVRFNLATAAVQGSASSPAPCEDGVCAAASSDAWREIRKAAQNAQDATRSCEFTSFIGYEWTGNPGTQNLHRNVLFASDVVPSAVTSYFEANQEEELWERLEEDCEEDLDGCEVLTIPHNSNLSAGLMFERVDAHGDPFDSTYVKQRAHMEPLVEVFQHKGSSECYSPTGEDEACTFEQMPYNTLASANLSLAPDTLLKADTVRDALLQGLKLEQQLGTNPFAYGLIASTDTHMATAGAVDEQSFQGHGGAGLAARDALPEGLWDQVYFNPGGLAVLWAEENTRASLFAAMRRREAYGTSGPRIQLRFFGGFDYREDACSASDFARHGYAGGVPMGGALKADVDAPTFLVRAAQDPGVEKQPGTPLSHIEIVKGWLDGDELRTRVTTIARAAKGGVDPLTCEPTGVGGQSELCASYRDDDFDPAELAFYYVRVFEQPTCRWHALACNAAGVECRDGESAPKGFEACCDEDYPRVQRERAWSSPIWISPR